MPTLGVTVSQRSTPPSRGQFSQTGTAFKVGLADLGPIGVAKKLQSIGDFILWYGARVTANQVFYDSVDTAFQEGTNVVWAARAVGPSKAYDAINLAAVSGTSLVWTANDPGVSGVKVQVTNGTDSSTRIVIVSNAATGAVIAQTAQFSDKTATPPLGLLGGGTLTAGGGSGLPVVAAATAPTGGSSDNASVTSTQITTAANLFLKSYGPGNISADGITVAGTPNVLWAHAAANNRFALADVPDTTTQSTITTYIATLTATDKSYGAFVGPWAQAPGLLNSPVTRNVPASAVYSGMLARIDRAGNVNRAAVGFEFAPQFVTSLNTEYDDTTLQTLYDTNALNSLQTYFGVLSSRGFRTPVDPAVDPIYNQANCSRLRMQIIALMGPVGAQYVGKPLDGKREIESAYASDIAATLLPLYLAKSLFGETPADAYQVDAGVTVNTATTISQGYLIAVVSYAPTPAAIYVQIQLAAIPISV